LLKQRFRVGAGRYSHGALLRLEVGTQLRVVHLGTISSYMKPVEAMALLSFPLFRLRGLSVVK
jgi:hypothetical protein